MSGATLPLQSGEQILGRTGPRQGSLHRTPVPRYRRAPAAQERAALARELHDGVIQTLTSMFLQLEEFKRARAGHFELQVLQDKTRTALDSLRDILSDLREVPAADEPFLLNLRGDLEKFEQRTSISALLVSTDWPERVRPATAHQIRRIVQEAMNNIALHSNASRALVRLAVRGGLATVVVEDNGLTMPDEIVPGAGLLGLAERAALLGGKIHVDRTVSGGGRVRLQFPVAGPVP